MRLNYYSRCRFSIVQLKGILMKASSIAIGAAILAASALAGCATNGAVTASAQGDITTAYNMICPNVAALASVVQNMNSKAQGAYASATAICAAGAPTNAVVAGLDLATIMNSGALAPYIANIKIGG